MGFSIEERGQGSAQQGEHDDDLHACAEPSGPLGAESAGWLNLEKAFTPQITRASTLPMSCGEAVFDQ